MLQRSLANDDNGLRLHGANHIKHVPHTPEQTNVERSRLIHDLNINFTQVSIYAKLFKRVDFYRIFKKNLQHHELFSDSLNINFIGVGFQESFRNQTHEATNKNRKKQDNQTS